MNRAITGAILAGGRSSRMGTDKALLNLDGRPFVAYVSATLQAVFDRVILIANDASAYGFLEIETFGDVYQKCGPLGGIHSALVHANGEDIFVSACDTPFVSRELVRYVVGFRSHAAVKIPSLNQQLHPLCGFYSQRCLQSTTEQLEAGRYRVTDFVDAVGATVIPISSDLPFYREDLFSNFNTPGDLLRNKDHV
jgi:molybdopterin-guanine dinucleotide biosynthesis protein A